MPAATTINDYWLQQVRNEIIIIWDEKIIHLENPGKINYKIIRD